MLREGNHIYRRLNVMADMAMTGLAYIISTVILGFISSGSLSIPHYSTRYFWLFYLTIVLWPSLLNINGLYPTNRLRTLLETFRIITYTSFQSFIFIMAILYAFKLPIVSRIQVLNIALLSTIFLVIKESIVSVCLHHIRKSGINIRSILIAGPIESADYFIRKLKSDGEHLGLRIMGLVTPSHQTGESEAYGQKILGDFESIDNILRDNVIDNVIITSYFGTEYGKIENIIAHCEEQGVEVWLPARLFNTKVAKPNFDEFLDIPMFVFRMEPRVSWQLLFKTVLDRLSGLLFSILSLPVIIIAAILIKMTSPGPVIFRQKRCGLHGRIFTIYKLRTMYVGAAIMKDTLKAGNIMSGPIFKMKKDPRITPVGAFLRKTSIDELPQFWNVLRGEMSLVGPRPPLPEEIKEYKGWHRRRLSMKPGITGLVQVSGRSDITDFDRWADTDLIYIDDWSLWLDFTILVKTVFVVLSTKGAK